MNEYQLAKANTITKFDVAYQSRKPDTKSVLQEVEWLFDEERTNEEVSNYIDDHTHPDY
jgi:hypothetical protein